NFGFIDGSVSWGIGADDWREGGSTEVRIPGRYQNFFILRYNGEYNRLTALTDLHRVVRLDLGSNPSPTDHDVAALRNLPQLKELRINRPNQNWLPRDEYRHHMARVLPYLAGNDALEELDLGGTDLTDEEMPLIGGLIGLKHLELSEIQITDKAI